MQEIVGEFSILASWSNVTKISGEIFPNVFLQFSGDEARGGRRHLLWKYSKFRPNSGERGQQRKNRDEKIVNQCEFACLDAGDLRRPMKNIVIVIVIVIVMIICNQRASFSGQTSGWQTELAAAALILPDYNIHHSNPHQHHHPLADLL